MGDWKELSKETYVMYVYKNRIVQAVFEIGNCFWAHQNWHPNFIELISQKNLIKPHELEKCQYT